ncbi:glycoside hydrolase family 32 protein [Agromyces neolithicus]|uniref:beta-fructofuranosidase n=1 Tax=Agromyces neolithicus TaxID=269420 RepID=A0ABP4YKT3_9MICO
MNALFFRPSEGWFGDVMPFVEDGICHLYYTHLDFDDEGSPTRSKRLKWAHLSTRDFVDFTEHATAIPAGEADQPDLLVGAGSVVGPVDGQYHAFYVGINPHAVERGEAEQVVLRATSTDLETWVKDPDFRFEADPRWYHRDAWRDPFVMPATGGGWRMLLCAQKDVTPARRGGAVGMAVSADLDHWEAQPPRFAPGTTLAPECPEEFELDGRSYLLYSTYSDRFAVRHRVREGEQWFAPAWDALDANDLYAATSVEVEGRRLLVGWLATRSGEGDRGKRQWGGDLVVHELIARLDGSLGARPLASRLEAFDEVEASIRPRQGEWTVAGRAARGRTAPGASFAWASLTELDRADDRAVLVRATVRIDETAEESGFAIQAADDFTSAYLLRFEPARGRFVFDRRPHRIEVPFDHDADRGYVSDPDFEIERPLAPRAEHEVTIIVEGSCISVYVDDVALTTRGYDLQGGSIGAYVSSGAIDVSGLSVGKWGC